MADRPRPFGALRLAAVAVAQAVGALIVRYCDGLGATRSRGEWPFRGPADGPHNGFPMSRR